MVLNLIAKFANSNNGSAGPYVVEEDRRVPLRDWLCDSLGLRLVQSQKARAVASATPERKLVASLS